MAIDRAKYIPKFVDEALELVALIESLLFDIKDGISVDDDFATLMRALHTLKGTSRMLEFKRIEALAHALESAFISLKEQRVSLSANAVKLILSALDLTKRGIDAAQNTSDDSIDIDHCVKMLEALAANEEFAVQEEEGERAAAIDGTLGHHASEGTTKHKGTKSDSIRLSIEKIDGIIKSIASLQSLEIAAKSISLESAAVNNTIKEVSEKLKALKVNAPQVRVAISRLERLGERINSMLRNYSADASNNIRAAYDTVVSLRTLPLSTILDNYPRYVHELSSELGKDVQLVIDGKENEIDKNIIESLSEILLHMVRNAIDHGIESPGERIAAGKSKIGKISIVCSRESGGMKISVSDDGRGIDLEKIRQRIIKEGIVTEQVAKSLLKEDLTNYIFQSGFSMSDTVNSLSGRGIGMDVVRNSIEALKGSVIVNSVQGQGVTFTIMVPLSIAAIMGFPVSSGGMKFMIPATFVDTIFLAHKDDVITAVDRPGLKYNGRMVKLYYLNQILQITTSSAPLSESFFVVMLHSSEDVAALVVDDIANMRSVMLKPMPGFMESMAIFSGIVLNEDYEMVSVLHIPAMIKMAKRVKTIDLKKRNLALEKMRKSILVVDDSRPTREIEREILASQGYLVDTAVDGADALKAAKAKQYDLICTDINMPVMDGFTLIKNIKNNESLSHIPIIVISSVASEESQRRASMLGASYFIIKNSFDNHNLLDAVKELIGGGHG
ncbi:MAG: response regulator [Treponema sp.]|nr:response regulator [Treponema sp.]